jgi:hypothetical protein
MKHHTVLSASVIRSFKPRLLDPIVGEFIGAIKRRYHFDAGPQVNQQIGLMAGFQSGRFSWKRRSIPIDQLNITYIDQRVTSIGVLTKRSTDDGVAFLDDLMSWAKRQYRLNATETFPTFYHSQLEVVFDVEPKRGFPSLQSLGQTVQRHLSKYGIESPEYEPTSIIMFIDTLNKQAPAPTPFAIERRVGSEFSENKFFSQAPLTTADHLAVLKQFEESLS